MSQCGKYSSRRNKVMTMVWIIYDIVENDIRNKIARLCLDSGLYRIQKSVFLGNLDIDKRNSLALQCENIIDTDVDSVHIFPMDRESFRNLITIGQEFDKKLVSDELITKFF